MIKKINEGFSSLKILITLIFLTSLAYAFSFILNPSLLKINREIKKVEEQAEIDNILTTVCSSLLDDKTPQSNSTHDDFFQFNNTSLNGFSININSLSSKIPFNFLPLDFYSLSYINDCFDIQKDTSFIEKERLEGTLFSSYEQVKDYISKDSFSNNFTLHSNININIADNESFGNLLQVLDLPEDIFWKRESLLSHKQFIQNDVDAELFLGVNISELKPYLITDPLFNIQFMEPEILESIVSWSHFGIQGVNQKLSSLQALIKETEITQEDICSILGITKNDELYYYLGVKTYFWEINIKGKCSECICILYNSDDGLYILQKQWL